MCKLYNCTEDNRRPDCFDKPKKAKKPLKRTPVSPISRKRARQLTQYRKRIKVWKQEHAYCEARLEGCTIRTTDVHHMRGRENEQLLNEEDWLAVCRECHTEIGLMSIDDQIEKGVSKSKHRK